MPSWPSARSRRCGTRTDFEATRTGLPPARRTRSTALRSKASRSTAIRGVGSDCPAPCTAATAAAEPAGELASPGRGWWHQVIPRRLRIASMSARSGSSEGVIGDSPGPEAGFRPGRSAGDGGALRLRRGGALALPAAAPAAQHRRGAEQQHREARQHDAGPHHRVQHQVGGPVEDRPADLGEHLEGAGQERGRRQQGEPGAAQPGGHAAVAERVPGPGRPERGQHGRQRRPGDLVHASTLAHPPRPGAAAGCQDGGVSRSIPDPGFADDDGTADPALTAALAAYSHGGG